MTSKERVDILYDFVETKLKDSGDIIECWSHLEYIEEDLSRLEKLEEENKKLVINLNVARGIARKRGKAVEIIKAKKVSIDLILSTNNYDDYISFLDPWEDQLKEEEYNLLKAVFGQ